MTSWLSFVLACLCHQTLAQLQNLTPVIHLSSVGGQVNSHGPNWPTTSYNNDNSDSGFNSGNTAALDPNNNGNSWFNPGSVASLTPNDNLFTSLNPSGGNNYPLDPSTGGGFNSGSSASLVTYPTNSQPLWPPCNSGSCQPSYPQPKPWPTPNPNPPFPPCGSGSCQPSYPQSQPMPWPTPNPRPPYSECGSGSCQPSYPQPKPWPTTNLRPPYQPCGSGSCQPSYPQPMPWPKPCQSGSGCSISRPSACSSSIIINKANPSCGSSNRPPVKPWTTLPQQIGSGMSLGSRRPAVQPWTSALPQSGSMGSSGLSFGSSSSSSSTGGCSDGGCGK